MCLYTRVITFMKARIEKLIFLKSWTAIVGISIQSSSFVPFCNSKSYYYLNYKIIFIQSACNFFFFNHFYFYQSNIITFLSKYILAHSFIYLFLVSINQIQLKDQQSNFGNFSDVFSSSSFIIFFNHYLNLVW